MKSLIIHMLELAKSRTLVILTAIVLPIISPLAFADSGTWSLEPTTSSARLFEGSTANPDSVNTGVARVTGKVMLDTNDLDNSVFDLSIYPADEHWGHALSMEGSLPTGYVPDATDHVLHEDFPELLSAIQDTNWPSVVQNEHCHAAYEGGGEGYTGPVCTGTLIAATHADNCQTAYSAGGEGYTGPVCTPPAGDQTTIVLDLKMLRSADGARSSPFGHRHKSININTGYDVSAHRRLYPFVLQAVK
jgi:hypothetical protein